eukprot:6056533-Amphidinium_carterae.1
MSLSLFNISVVLSRIDYRFCELYAVRSELNPGILKTHANRFKKLDQYFFIDSTWLKNVYGEGGTSAIFDLFRSKCLPTSGSHLELTQAVKSAEGILVGSFCKYVAEAAQNQLKAAVKLLQSLASEEPPDSIGTATQFMLDCWSRAPLFYTYVAEVESEEQEGKDEELAVTSKILTGLPGLEALWECLQGKEDGDVLLSQLVPLHTYAPWLSADIRKAVRERKGRLERGVAMTATAKAKAKPAAAESKKRKASSTSDAAALTAARELLGRRRKA